MAYMNPQQYLDAITGGRGGRVTAYQRPSEEDPDFRNILQLTGDWQNRTGANGGRADLSGARAASGTYEPMPVQQIQGTAAPGRFQQGLQGVGEAVRSFGQRQGGEQPSLYPSDIGQAAPGYGYGPSASPDSDDPQSLMSKVGGFFTRPGMGQTLATLGSGIATESDRPGGSFWTGLARGSEAAVLGEQRRQMVERQQQAADRALAQEEEERAAQKRVNEEIQEITGGWDENTTPEQKVSDYQRAFNTAIGNGDHALAGRIREMTAYLSEGPEAGPAVRYQTWDRNEGRAPDGTPTRVREVTAGAPGTIGDRSYFVPDLYTEQVSEGVDPAEAARNSWRTGGHIADPEQEKEAKTRTGQERLNARLGEAAYDGLMLMVTDPATVDPETGETIPGQPNFNDYIMAGAVQQLDGSWEQGTPADPEAWQAFLASLISNAGSETTGFGGKLLGFFGRSVFLKDNPEILTGYTNALNYINPTVRFLSGAQMTNQEAMRYYNALIPAPGDPIPVIEMKRRKRDVLTNAMGGPGISDAARRRAREALDLDKDELMVHEHGAFGGDSSGQEAADYYLARLVTAVGITDMTDYSAVRRQVGTAGGLGSDLVIGGNR